MKSAAGLDNPSRRRNRKNLHKWLNSPLSVTLVGGILVLLISTFIQDRYWVSQQQYLLKESRRAHKIASASSTEEEVFQAMGRRLTGVAVLIGAHEGRFDKKQHHESLLAYNKSRDEWDNIEEILKLKIGIYFDDNVEKSWGDLLKEFLDLDTLVIEKLDEWDTEATASEHVNLTGKARKALEKVTDDLRKLSHQMNGYISGQESP